MHFDSQDGLALDTVETMLAASDDQIWLGTQGAPSCWDPRRRQFVHHARPDGLSGAIVTALACGPDGRVWAGVCSTAVLYGWCGEGFDPATPPGDRTVYGRLLVDRRGGVWGWAAHSAEAWMPAVLGRYDPESRGWRRFGQADGYCGEKVEGILEDREGQVWVGTEQGLLRWDGQRFEALREGDRVGRGCHSLAAGGSGGRLWVGTENRGLCCYDPNWSVYGTPDGLPADAVTGLAD
ncbi:MAG: hypothetical protein M5U12_08550 [Verrucomicrobia bacterium]|nr:hypothetical protein [Verrucomicrobiota bacterium]